MIRPGIVASIWMVTANLAVAQTDDMTPLSAIDWLSESVEQPETVALPAPNSAASNPTRTPSPDEAPVAQSATVPNVTVQPLGGPAPRALGLLAPEASGLPGTLWVNSDAEVLAMLLQAEQIDTLPALQDLLLTLAISEALPPVNDTDGARFFLARVDKLLEFGAMDAAQAMLEEATPDTPRLFRRWFDVTLLTGTEDRACRSLQDKPDVGPTPSARVFCLARSGDWNAAALTLNTSRALGDLDDADADLLARFLDPELFENEAELEPPARVTPLSFRMFEAIGSPLPTEPLPRAFSHADLRPNVGWKARLEAAERLARSGAISEATLVELYTARVPAASGGAWDRARSVIALDRALTDGSPDDIGLALRDVWGRTRSLGLSQPLAQHFAARLLEAQVAETEHDVLFKFLLLTDLYETAALRPDLAETDPFLAALAQGDPSDALALRPAYPVLRDAFAADPDDALVAMNTNGQTGEAILRAIAITQQGIDGDLQALPTGLATLRALGLEDVARRAALQYAILP